MTKLETALIEVTSSLDELGIPYMLVGGMAVTAWGEPRATLDVDLSVSVDPTRLPEIIDILVRRFRSVADPLQFVERTRVLPIMTAEGVRADIVFAALEIERQMLARAVQKSVGDRSIRVASVEDLIYMKLISERGKDREDATKLLRRFRKTLDREYLAPKLAEMSEALARMDILETYRGQVERG